MDVDIHTYANSQDEILLLTNHIHNGKALDWLHIRLVAYALFLSSDIIYNFPVKGL